MDGKPSFRLRLALRLLHPQCQLVYIALDDRRNGRVTEYRVELRWHEDDMKIYFLTVTAVEKMWFMKILNIIDLHIVR